jgi:CO dehydrogenase/acetyl-CoA synthase beta subunit
MPFGRDGEARTMALLQASLAPGTRSAVPEDVRGQLMAAMATDVADLHAHLQPRGHDVLESTRTLLTERGRREADEFEFNDEEKRQRDQDVRHWEAWLSNVQDDLAKEPERIRDFYRVQSWRIEPVGLVYLWPA